MHRNHFIHGKLRQIAIITLYEVAMFEVVCYSITLQDGCEVQNFTSHWAFN